MMTTSNLGLYIHIPFCVKKCSYCDFVSFEGCDDRLQREYAAELVKEIRRWGLLYEKRFQIDTIFFGGGTPSLMDERLICEIIASIRESFPVESDAEITLEANPGTLKARKLEAYRAAGINRLSIGVQSLDDGMLKNLGRIHSVDEFLKNYTLARKYEFNNINIDLMFAIPGHSLEIWADTLRKALELAPEHISFYSLQIEENTRFYTMLKSGEIQQISDVLDREMYHMAIEALNAAGYTHYEISNACKQGYECRHNLKYWSMENYLGLGLGAHSYIDGLRFSMTQDLQSYLNGEKINWQHKNDLKDDVSEYIFTGMRKTRGISFEAFRKRFGKELFEFYPEQRGLIGQYEQNGFIEVRDGFMRFTVKGFDISNRILSEFV